MFALRKKTFAILGALLLIGIAVALMVSVVRPKTSDTITATVERGSVEEIVSVSGFVEAKNTAELAFPVTGKVTEVFVTEGIEVKAGEILATLASSELVAERNDATAGLRIAEAQYEKLNAGASTETRATAEISLQNAKQVYERTISVEKEKVEKAKRSLLSDDLTALSANPNEDAEAPIISGSYTCADEGQYIIDAYNSNAYSGYSYQFSGLENGISALAINQTAPLGSCGLYIQFSDSGGYHGSSWIISIPNKQGDSYIANANAYELALKTEENEVASAKEAYDLAAQEAAEVNAGPRSEEVDEANGIIAQRAARIAQIDAQIDDRSIVAPFDGTVTDVSISKGETAPSSPVVTVLASNAFELKARIPEIDITKIEKDQRVSIVFDAKEYEAFEGHIAYISPLATIIDGVAYFEATVEIENTPSWIRSGLNADVDIIVDKKEDVLRIPKRFVIDNGDGTHSIRVQKGNSFATTTITLEFSGNDGYVHISGLNEGDIVVAP